jgi:hypothetical protein
MMFRVLSLSSILMMLACAPEKTTVSCNSPMGANCATYTFTGGTPSSTTCLNGSVPVSSCANTDVIGRCSANNILGSTCPSGLTCTTNLVVYTGGDTATYQTACMAIGGTWSDR